jgi:predicted Zn-dependent peptidase
LQALQGQFVSEDRGALHAHILTTDKYKMTSVWVQFERPLRREGVTDIALLPHVLLRGTRRHPTPEGLMRAFDDLYGASMSARSGKRGDAQTVELTLQLPADRYIGQAAGVLEEAVRLLAEVALDPNAPGGAFFESGLETEKTLHRQRIDNLVNDKMAYATERCAQLLCAGEPCGIPRLGYREDLDAITPESLFARYSRLLGESAVYVYVVGPDPAERVLRAVRDAFAPAAANAGSEDLPVMRPLPVRIGEKWPELTVERMDVNQAKLHMGARLGIGYADDEYPALLVFNGVLGGFEHSKLFVNVREKESMAYYAYSRLEALKGLLYLAAGIQADHFAKARRIVEAQLEAIVRREISDEELEFTKEALTNQYLLSDDQPFTPAMMRMFARYSGRERAVEDLMQAVREVAVDDVARVARRVSLETVYLLRGGEVSGDAGQEV